MLNLEIDGKSVQVPDGSTVMDAANQLGIYVPHFCYHQKLSIAANCRMCLVEVEKAPKPLPACATPVTDGMKVKTQSASAVNAQQGVMELLLINHPLDCPICDQGGECQLQDLAVGYGKSSSRYDEPKRVVFNKDLGSLIATDMTRCIHCTRCVRFGQEVAGIMELGMAGRGEHSEIMAFVGQTVDSELSGNMIDLCPVGALTSKPFRYKARTWELSRRKSVSPHDSTGSNLIVQVKNNQVMRVVPFENEAVNECWLSDRDRFSYEGLNAPDRLTKPMLKRDGVWSTVDWTEALDFIVEKLGKIMAAHGTEAIAALSSPQATLEELYLLQKFLRGLGSSRIDSRLWQTDFSLDGCMQGIPWLGMPIADLSKLDSVLLVGSTLRKDHPLLAHRIRQATKKGGQIGVLHAVDDDLLMPIAAKQIVPPSLFAHTLAAAYQSIAKRQGKAIPPEIVAILGERLLETDAHSIDSLVDVLLHGERRAIFLGNAALLHPQYAQLHWLVTQLADLTGATTGVFHSAANSVGSYLAGAVPQPIARLPISDEDACLPIVSPPPGHASTQPFWEAAGQAYFLMHVEPELDTVDPRRALARLEQAELVVLLSAYQGRALELGYADVLLPIAPFTETGGTFVNTEGRVQSFHGVVPPLGETRPAWKVWQTLGNRMALSGFTYQDVAAVRAEILPDGEIPRAWLSNQLTNYPADLTNGTLVSQSAPRTNDLERLVELPVYQSDPIVRRALALQKTRDAKAQIAEMHTSDIKRLKLDVTTTVRMQQGAVSIVCAIRPNDRLARGVVRWPMASSHDQILPALLDSIQVEQA